MCGDIEIGTCEICFKEAQLQRTYFKYPIKCECHSPNHFEIVRHCKNCISVAPIETRVLMTTETINNSITMNKDKFEHLLNCMCNQKYIHEQCSKVKKDWQEIIDKAYHEARGLLSVK